MKVTNSVDKPVSLTDVSGKEDKKVSENGGTSFQSRLARVEGRNFEERIKEMVGKIIEQGEKLAKKVDIRELKAYKNLISEFLDEVVANSHKFSKQNFLDRRGRYKVYAVIKQINEEVDLLTKEVLSGEMDNIKILQRLDDIRGLVLDITM